MHLRPSTTALLLCSLLSLFASASSEPILHPLDLALHPRQASPSTTTSSSSAAVTSTVPAEDGSQSGGEGGGEGGASGGGANPVIAAGSMGVTSSVTSASSKAGAAPRATGEVNARALAMGAAGLIVGGML